MKKKEREKQSNNDSRTWCGMIKHKKVHSYTCTIIGYQYVVRIDANNTEIQFFSPPKSHK